MKLAGNKLNGAILLVATALTGIGVVSSFAEPGFLSILRTHASPFTITLDSSNAPTLSGGEATRVDDKNITWEYHNASNYANGHVTLNSDSYVGVSFESNYGITAINGITANFTVNANSEGLWLLKSTDGIEWHEVKILTTGQSSSDANNWRYVRFYNYTSTININSITINYECSGISATEDVDLAKEGNVRDHNILEAEATNTISPNSVGGQALRLKNGQSGDSSYIIVSFPQIDSWHSIFTSKIEFDYCHSINQYKPSIALMNGNKVVGTTQKFDTTKSNYKATDISTDWWHIELAISSMTAFYVDYTDTATKNQPVDGIKIISSGNCIVDNLKIGSSPCGLGNYNSSSYQPSVGTNLWVKTCWVGILHSVDIEDSAYIRYAPTANSPFYVECIASGAADTVTTIVCGYNHRTQTIHKTITIN